MTTEKTEVKWLVAYKVTIADILDGPYKSQEGFASNYVETSWGLKISRVHIIATVTAQYVSEDGKYAFLTLDDGTEAIRSKAFQNTGVLSKIKKGEIVEAIGKVREYNDERFIVPEIVRVVKDPNLITLRKLECHKFKKEFMAKNGVPKEKPETKPRKEKLEEEKPATKETKEKAEKIKEEENKPAKEKSKELKAPDEKEIREIVVKAIESLDKGEGVDYADILKNVKLEESLVEKAIDELLSEGSCYEPRAGKIKVL